MAYGWKVRDRESYCHRLERFLTDKCLLFNPYRYSDARLLAGVEKMRWRGEFSLTQMVVLHFLKVETEGSGFNAKEKVTYRVGDSPQEITEYMNAFTTKRTAADSLHQVRSTINGHPVTHSGQIRFLVGKSVFVSRSIVTLTRRGAYAKALAMHRLTGDSALDAAVIRKAIIDAKLEMLDRLLDYPEAGIYLDGEPSEPVDIRTPIQHIKSLISTYAHTPLPLD